MILTDTIDDVQIFTNEFSAFLTTVKHRNQNAYICGDFNINLLSINTKKHAAEYFDRAVSIGFFPKITLPTRLQGASHTLIDNIWSSNMDENPLPKSGILINDTSDHKMIFTYIEKTAYVEKLKKFIETEKRDEIAIQNFTDELKNVHIYHQLLEMNEANLEEKHEKLAAILKCAKDKHMPKQNVKYNKKKHKKSKWMTQAILNSINMKGVLYKKFIQANNEDENIYSALKEEYTRYRKTLRHSIREAKKMYYTRTFNIYKNDMKTTWKIINDTLRRKSSTSCDAHFISNGQIIKNHDEIADQFNHFFISIGSKLSPEIQPMNDHKQYLRNPTESQLIFTSVEEQHALTIINNLKDKSSYGHDGISNNLIKRIKDVLIKPLTLLINQMLSSGHFPSQLKISRVIPLFKSGDPELFSNYRPISLLPSLSKIFEQVIFNQLFNYMNNNKLLCLEQYGFRPGHSTELAALQLVNKITEQMDIGKILLSIHMDLSKAFDTLDHSILLSKLAYYGIGRDMCNNLLKSYLTDRYQYVEYKSARSPTKSIITGVPQGSILGPLLFLIYINDLPMVSQIFDMIMYADDTTLYCNINRDISDQ